MESDTILYILDKKHALIEILMINPNLPQEIVDMYLTEIDGLSDELEILNSMKDKEALA